MHAPRGNLPIARKGVQITDGGAALKGRKITDGGAALKGRKITDGGESPRKGTHHHKALKGRQNLYSISVVPSALFYPMMYYRGLIPPSVVLRPFGARVNRLFVVAIKKEHRRQSFQTFDGAKVSIKKRHMKQRHAPL